MIISNLFRSSINPTQHPNDLFLVVIGMASVDRSSETVHSSFPNRQRHQNVQDRQNYDGDQEED